VSRNQTALVWAARAAWASLPFALGPVLGDALAGWSADVRTTATIGLWAVWLLTMIATLVPHPIALTAWRVAAPAPAVAAALAAAAGEVSPIGIGVAIVAAALAFSPAVGMAGVNGPAYPNERRYPLRPPATVLAGPAVVAWIAIVGGPGAAVLLLADHRWAVGAVVSVAGSAAAVVAARALHGLSRRWLVFVPAGVVLHDPLTLADPVLFQRPLIASFGPAPADPDGQRLDLTAGALGLAIAIHLREPTGVFAITKAGRRPTAETVDATELVFTPTRPSAVLADAVERAYRLA
jgi:hypothetical protein